MSGRRRAPTLRYRPRFSAGRALRLAAVLSVAAALDGSSAIPGAVATDLGEAVDDRWLVSEPGHPVVERLEELAGRPQAERRRVADSLYQRGEAASVEERALLAMLITVYPDLRDERDSGEDLLERAIEQADAAGDLALSARLLIEEAYRQHRWVEPESVPATLSDASERASALAATDPSAGTTLEAAAELVRLMMETERRAGFGDVDRRLAEIEPVIRESGTCADRLRFLSTAATVAHELGDGEGAIERFGQQLRVAQRHGRVGAAAAALIDRAAARVDLTEATDDLREQVRRDALEGLALASEVDAVGYIASAQLLLADFSAFADAEEGLGECLGRVEPAGASDLAALCRMARAALRAERADDAAVGEPVSESGGRLRAEASRDLELALERASEAGPRLWPYLWSYFFRALWSLEPDRARAVEEAEAMLAVFETYFDYEAAEREDIAAVWTEANDWLVGKLLGEVPALRPGSLTAAFRIGERMRARSLVEIRHAGEAEPLAEEVADRLDALAAVQLRRLRELRAQLSGGQAPADEVASLGREESALRTELDALGLPGTGFHAPQPAALPDVQRELAADEAILIFQLGADHDTTGRFAGGSWLLVVRRDSVRVHPLPLDRWRLDGEPVHAFLRLEDPSAVPELRAYLYDLLLRPALDELAQGEAAPRRLIVVPDRALFMLPFAALGPVGEPPVVERAAIQVVPSATLWLQLRRQAAAAERPPLLLAAPELAPARRVRDRLPPLPTVRSRASCLQRALGDGTELWLGPLASESRLRDRDPADHGSLWLVAHATADGEPDSPIAVHLAAGSAPEDGVDGGRDDGDLTPQEIEELSVGGRLVVLAACDSGVGENIRGEGPMSLARSFFLAGARTVVATYWQVEDGATACWVGELAERLRAGQAVDEALAALQRRWRGAGRPAREWAPMVVLGDGTLRPFAGNAGGAVSTHSPGLTALSRCCRSPAERFRRAAAWSFTAAAAGLLLAWIGRGRRA